MMEERQLNPGDVVQISPENARQFGGMLCVVTEPKAFGCQGYLLHHADFEACRVMPAGKAFIRLKFADMEYVGTLTWMHMEGEDVCRLKE